MSRGAECIQLSQPLDALIDFFHSININELAPGWHPTIEGASDEDSMNGPLFADADNLVADLAVRDCYVNLIANLLVQKGLPNRRFV